MLQELRLEQIDFVMKNAKHVKIRKDKLDEWALYLKDMIYVHPWKQYKDDFTEKEIIILAFIIESMNFCFWKEPMFEYKDQKRSTAMTDKYIDSAKEDKRLVDINYLIFLCMQLIYLE